MASKPIRPYLISQLLAIYLCFTTLQQIDESTWRTLVDARKTDHKPQKISKKKADVITISSIFTLNVE